MFLLFFIIFAQSLKAGPDSVPEADGIVVFTGTSPVRIETGLELLGDGKGQRLLISGVYEDQDFDMILAMAGADAERLRCCIDLDYRATNTVGNTQETALWAEVHGFSSLIVVTSSHHMPRAFLNCAGRCRPPACPLIRCCRPMCGSIIGMLIPAQWRSCWANICAIFMC